MATMEPYWNAQKNSLKRIRKGYGNENRPTRTNKQLTSRGSSYNIPSKHYRSSRTPPAHLPRLDTPPHHSRSPTLRGTKYGVVPPVYGNGRDDDDDDSWGDDSDPEEEGTGRYPHGYPGTGPYPYPVVMYPTVPMMVPPGATGSTYPTGRRKGHKTQKRVRYRETPMVLSSRNREKRDADYNRMSGGGYYGYNAPDLAYLRTSMDPDGYDPFDPRSNSVLARYSLKHTEDLPATLECLDYLDSNEDFRKDYMDSFIISTMDDEFLPDIFLDVLAEETRLDPDHPYYPDSFFYCEDLLDKQIARHLRDIASEVAGDALREMERDVPQRDPSHVAMAALILDVVRQEAESIVKDVAFETAAKHMEKAATYDILMEIATEIWEESGPDVARDAILDTVIEDIIDEELVEPEVDAESKEVTKEVLQLANDRERRREIRELKRSSGGKMVESVMLDKLLSLLARQGQLWTEREHAERLLDDVMLNVLLAQLFDVDKKRKQTCDNKPVRNYYEKTVTDVALDSLLDELRDNLDQDLADLDEYEQGIQDLDPNKKYPKELQKWFEGR